MTCQNADQITDEMEPQRVADPPQHNNVNQIDQQMILQKMIALQSLITHLRPEPDSPSPASFEDLMTFLGVQNG
ncbi:hypothetical protein CL622_04235 [archaeon]|nr:hypothetical protein [archaeon]